jgi:hypothetical protein
MESIFGEASEDTLQESSPLLSSTQSEAKPRTSKRSSSGKNFSDDLQSFLQSAFDDSLEQQLAERSQKKPLQEQAKVKKRHRRPLSGLDALIRSTVDPKPARVDSSKAKRVTLTFDPKKLEKLKAIARNRKAYLKDVIDEIVAEYLDAKES